MTEERSVDISDLIDQGNVKTLICLLKALDEAGFTEIIFDGENASIEVYEKNSQES